jgi:starvation-inducible DNA-binding protein
MAKTTKSEKPAKAEKSAAKSTAKAFAQDAPNPTRNDLDLTIRKQMVTLLNQQLADTADLFTQVKQAHWNVKGPQFIAVHKLFDDFADDLVDTTDDLAERAVQLGGNALGTARMAASATRLPEFPATAVGSMAAVTLLADRFAALAESTRAAIDVADAAGDADTADLFTGISRMLDKALWFLEAHLQE